MEEIFALDIGTRKVMGIFARKNGACLDILDVEVIEHPSRPMFDGQIHSIEDVAKTVKQIKHNLELRLNKQLKQVGVAVAGRSLVTFKEKVVREDISGQEIDSQLVRNLELEAVDKIVSDSGRNLAKFYCVGYSPIHYELDGNRISNLIGHNGKTISAEVIATFLPRVVLDSIFNVLQKSGLEAISITLEPIAAINAIIPAEMRHLNILLVDVGAGTSDLALTREGVVFAYGMVPEAGDEISEVISENLLVDFNTAERIKRLILAREQVTYEDIWGRKHVAATKEIKQDISHRVRKLTDSIAESAINLNAGVPQAIVGVGGGSQTFNLVNALALSFGISVDKIGIRMPSAINGIQDNTKKLTGPEAITPLGIAIMTARATGLRFINVTVNNNKLVMLDFHQKKDILGALILSGIDGKKLYPRPGLALAFKVNGQLQIIKGTMGAPAKLTLNNQPASSLSCKIKSGDDIEFEQAEDGQDAQAFIGDLKQLKPVKIFFNKEPVSITQAVLMDGKKVSFDTPILDRAVIEIIPLNSRDVLASKDINADTLQERQILVNLNSQPRILTQRNFKLFLNGVDTNLDTEIKDNDEIKFSTTEPTFYKIKDIAPTPENNEQMHINVDGKGIEIAVEPIQIFMNGRKVSPEEFLIDGADIKICHIKRPQILLSEIFRYIDVDVKNLKGKTMRILVNDQPAGFTTPLSEGSRVKIMFEDVHRENLK